MKYNTNIMQSQLTAIFDNNLKNINHNILLIAHFKLALPCQSVSQPASHYTKITLGNIHNLKTFYFPFENKAKKKNTTKSAFLFFFVHWTLTVCDSAVHMKYARNATKHTLSRMQEHKQNANMQNHFIGVNMHIG